MDNENPLIVEPHHLRYHSLSKPYRTIGKHTLRPISTTFLASKYRPLLRDLNWYWSIFHPQRQYRLDQKMLGDKQRMHLLITAIWEESCTSLRNVSSWSLGTFPTYSVAEHDRNTPEVEISSSFSHIQAATRTSSLARLDLVFHAQIRSDSNN